MKTSISAIAALIVVSSFAGSALADGDYYEGTSKTQASAKVDNVNTGSIGQTRVDTDRGQVIFQHESRDNR
ncbi:hypothetical protein [Rhizobium terrae]|uniref:hypothetical protein n=1 Tax=Rhizobium terrae TaxID=2171756 RepID=UPI000E3ECFC3|nr:hypothetical protein [Rhizobium terrae]